MYRIERTDSSHPGFRELIPLLDRELALNNGDEQAFYTQFNGVENIRHVVVAFDGDLPVGCGAFKAYSNEETEIKRMFVKPDHRGKGVAYEVLRELENWSAENGFRACVLETGVRQTEALHLYNRAGYARIPNYGQYAGMENSVCLRKEVASSATG